jgi:hypothetical protein
VAFAEQINEFLAAYIVGWGIPEAAHDQFKRNVRPWLGQSGWSLYLARVKGRAAAAATLFVHLGVGFFADSATTPMFRRLKNRLPATPSLFLHQDVQHHPVLIHGAPKVVLHAVQADENLIQIPPITRPQPASAQSPGEFGAELAAPTADAFVRDHNTTFGEDELDIP